jgi:hypothetical protein
MWGGRGVRLTGGAGREKSPEKQCPTSKVQNCYFLGSKNRQNFTISRSHYQEHNATTNTEKKLLKFGHKYSNKLAGFQSFQEFYGSG